MNMNRNLQEKRLRDAFKRFLNEGREEVLAYFNRLAKSKTEVASVAFDCPFLPQDMRQRIMDISRDIEGVMDEMVEKGFVDSMDKPGVEFRSNQWYERNNDLA